MDVWGMNLGVVFTILFRLRIGVRWRLSKVKIKKGRVMMKERTNISLAMVLFLAFLVGYLTLSGNPSSAAAWEPTGTVRFIAIGGPGSGVDGQMRNFALGFTESGIIKSHIQVENWAGAAGAVAFAKIGADYKGAENMVISVSASTVASSIANTWEVTPMQTTPIAAVVTDWSVMVCNAGDKEHDTLEKIAAKLKKDPKSVKFGGNIAPDADYLVFAMLLKEIGVDINEANYVIYDGGGPMIPALMGGHIDVALSGGTEFSGPIEAGQLTGVAVASKGRLKDGALSNTPTFIEQGYNIEFGAWRAIFAPADVSPEMVAYWRKACEELVKTDAFKKICKNMDWEINFVG
jgi:tripartite-type tricarboxylate transporter receptor subunit TctC